MLKVDMYVRIVLTVIAISLVVIAFGPVFNTPTEAQTEAQEVDRPLSIAVGGGREGHSILWIVGNDGIKLVGFTDVGRVSFTRFISYSGLSGLSEGDHMF